MASDEKAPDDPPLHFRVEVPDDLKVGAYANFCSVWHGPHEFTLDFAVTGQAEANEKGVTVPTSVVARVRIPLAMASDLLAALARQMTAYEEAAGPIRKPGDDRPLFPPGDLE